MIRDLDLIRNILLAIEANTNPYNRLSVQNFVSDDYDEFMVSGHIKLLLDCDFIEASKIAICGQAFDDYIIKRLTMFGFDYLDSVRSDSVWDATKAKIKEVASGASLDVVKTVASSVILSALGI